MNPSRFLRLLSHPCLAGATVLLTMGAFGATAPAAAPPTLPPAVIDAARYPDLQAALDAVPESGGLVRLPPGNFELHRPLLLTRGDTQIEGAGTATHLINRNTAGEPALIIRAADRATNRRSRIWRVQVENFRISGNPQSGDGLLLEGVNEVLVHGLSVDHNGGHGISLVDCYGITLSANVIAHELGGGVDLRDAWGCTVSANTFVLVQPDSVVVRPDSGRITIAGNNFANSYIGGKDRRPAESPNPMGRDGGGGVLLQGTRDVVISGNSFSGLGTEAVRAEGACERIIVTSNIMTDLHRLAPGKKPAIRLGSAKASIVKDNAIAPGFE
jgi:parallel beta-helix repeat protein